MNEGETKGMVIHYIFKSILVLIIIGGIFSHAAQNSNKKKKTSKLYKLAPKLGDHRSSPKLDPYLGFKPETDPTKVKLHPSKMAGSGDKNPSREASDLIENQREELNKFNNRDGLPMNLLNR